jgi:hypothetical protein
LCPIPSRGQALLQELFKHGELFLAGFPKPVDEKLLVSAVDSPEDGLIPDTEGSKEKSLQVATHQRRR